jgi:hypothetical protein
LREGSGQFGNAVAKIGEYARAGYRFFAPGVIVAECLFVFCRKLTDGVISQAEHVSAIDAFLQLMSHVNPPPTGDMSLIKRAEEIRGGLGCSRSADGIYLALAEELTKESATEVITFDNGMKAQATASNSPVPVVVIPTILITASQ